MRGTRLRTAPFLSANGVKKGGEFAKKAEFTNILFNIMNGKRAKGVINVERELQHSGRGMNNTEGNAA